MKYFKNILLIVLLLTNVFFIVFAQIKVNEVERLRYESEANLKLAEQHQKTAEAALTTAEKATFEAIQEKRLADELRAVAADCLDKK